MRQALLVMAEAADMINDEIRAGKPPCNACECDDTMKHTMLHACAKCTEPTVCATRRQDWRGAWVCRFYQIREANMPSQNMIAKILERSLQNAFRNECARLGFDHKTAEQQEVYDDALKDLQMYIKGTTKYYDEYRSRDIDLTANAHLEGHGRYSPDLPSVDGIFSFFECNDKLRYHCEGNVAVTALAINLMKHTHAPAMLDHISEFVRSNKTEEDVLKILSKTTNTALIRIKVPYKLRSRTGRSLDKQQIRKDIREWITDRPTPSDAKMFSTARLRVHGWLKLGNAKRWTAQDRQRLMKVVVEIEHEFKIHLPRGQDGCPWFGIEEAMPKQWLWKDCFLLVATRLERMRFWCNRYWKSKCLFLSNLGACVTNYTSDRYC